MQADDLASTSRTAGQQSSSWLSLIVAVVLVGAVLQIAVAGPITKGQASDLISTDKCSLAEPAQRARLQVGVHTVC